MTTDTFFLTLANSTDKFQKCKVPARDKKILLSFLKIFQKNMFLTTNQANLLVKILKENKKELQTFSTYNDDLIESPKWSKPFRMFETVKKIYTKKHNLYDFFVEFSYNPKIKQLITETILKSKYNQMSSDSNTISIIFTEENLYNIIKTLILYNFEIEENLVNFYNDIEQIKKNKAIALDGLGLENFYKKALIEDIGIENIDNELLLLDRQLRYGFTKLPVKTPKILPDRIASRTSHKVWIDINLVELSSLIDSLRILKRSPLLIIFDSHDTVGNLKNLTKLNEIFTLHNMSIDVYFRHNSATGHDFNLYISENKLNKKLDKNSNCAILCNSKLPKFFLNSEWYPKSVISFSNNFNLKISSWCDAVDLIIYYTDKQPIINDTHAILQINN